MHVYSTPITPPPTTISVFGMSVHRQNLIAVDDVAPVDLDSGRSRRLGAHADDHVRGFDRDLAPRILDLDVGGIDEARLTREHLDVVARELGVSDVDLGPDDVLDAKQKIGHRDLFLHPVVHPVDGLIVVAREVNYRLPHGLAGNGAGVDADAAEDFALLNQRDILAGLRRPGWQPSGRPVRSR